MSDTGTSFDDQIAALTASLANMDPAGNQNELLPTPIGVPKYRVDESGNIAKDSAGNPIPWSTTAPGPSSEGGWTSMVPGGTTHEQRARYYSHDAWTLIDALAPEDVYDTQRQLIDTGLLDAKGVVAGMWTNKEANAFQQVLSTANQSGVTWDVALSHMAALGRQNPKERKKVQRPALEVRKANPFALKQIADSVSEQRIGRRLTDAESARFVEWWGQHEDAANAEKVAIANAEANDTMNAEGDTVTVKGAPLESGDITPGMVGAPDVGLPAASTATQVGVHTLHDEMTPEQAAEQFLRERNPNEIRVTDQLSQFHNFLDIINGGPRLGGGVPGRPGA